MSPKRPQGLWRRGAVYQYRVRVPHDLVRLLGTMRINRSLRTSSFHEALRAVMKIAYEIELEFERARASARSGVGSGTATATKPASRPIVLEIAPGREQRTLQQTIDAYMCDPARSRTAKTEAVYRTTYATISTILGPETPVAEIGRDECRDLLTVLQRLPSNARKHFPSLSPREAAEHARAHGIAPMSTANINEYMNKLSTLLNWALAEEWVNRNPAKGLRVADPSSKTDRRRPFSTQQLVRIFNAPIFRGCRDDGIGFAISGTAHPRRSRFWLPLIALYSGMRLNEIAQLHTTDLNMRSGAWCFEIKAGRSDDKQLKTSASERIIPVHPILVRIGLLKYHAERVALADKKLFPEIALDAFGMHSGRFSRWFSRFLRTCGASAERTCFHSFRHCFRDALREARVDREIVLNLGGWSASTRGSHSVGDSYGQGFRPNRLAEAIARVEYPSLDLTELFQF